MADKAYLRYSQRVAAQRPGGRYDLSEMWIVPNITNTGGGTDRPGSNWQHEALTAEGLPQIGDHHVDGGYTCVGVELRSLESQKYAYVNVKWQEDPLTLVTEVNYLSMEKQKPAWQGIAQQYGGPDDKAPPDAPPDPDEDELIGFDPREDIRNSAGDRYNPPVVYEIPLERVEITFRCSLLWHDTGVPAGDHEAASGFVGNWEDYLNHWNKTDYVVTQTDPDQDKNTSTRTFPKGTLMFKSKRALLVKEPYFHRVVTCIFLHDPDMWGTRLPDMGPRCRKHLALDGGKVVLASYTGNDHDRGRGAVTDCMGRNFGGTAELDGRGGQLLPKDDGNMPSAVLYAWWPVNDDGDLLSAEFDDLQLFTPERALDI